MIGWCGVEKVNDYYQEEISISLKITDYNIPYTKDHKILNTIEMQKETKHIYFSTKKRTRSYERRTVNPYAFERTDTCSLAVRRGLSHYKRIIAKNCRINDIQKCINRDSFFPMNAADYTNLLIVLSEISDSFLYALSIMSPTIRIFGILRLAYHPVKDNSNIIKTLLHSELHSSYPANIRKLAKTLKKNLASCIEILNYNNDQAIKCEDLTSTQLVEFLETYVRRMKTACSFIQLIILKKNSTRVTKMLPVIKSNSPKVYFCSVCGLDELICKCFVDCDDTSNTQYDDFGHSSKVIINANKDNVVAHGSNYSPRAEVDDGDFWSRYLKQHYVPDTDKRYSQQDSTDSD